ncbi:MAG: dihydrofolate reductase [Flavobacteriaceae bacterium]|nr:MAG: dihydrofolate reductase [Flavobacteriaceae bacterium]
MIQILVATDLQNAIGLNNELLWHLPLDLKRFKQLTLNNPIVMGRKTFESIGRPLPGRANLVLSRDKSFQPQGVMVFSDLPLALKKAAEFTDAQNPKISIIGGEQIYRQSLDLADKLELTLVHTQQKADAFFPEIDTENWQETSREFHPKDPNHAFDFEFISLVRKENK